MKLIDAIKEKGKPFLVPDCSRDDLPLLLKTLNFKVGAEIGVHKAEFTRKLLNADLKIFAIDIWERPEIYEMATQRLKRYQNCTIMKKPSTEAVKEFEDESLDFVYIDADHRFPYVAEDIYFWSKKVKRGGIISGHDYMDERQTPDTSIRDVGPVVDAFVKANGIENFYVFGRSKPIEEEGVNDRVSSFMFFKP